MGRFFWHLGNARRTGGCCSGLRAWNTYQCLEGAGSGGKASIGICTVDGQNRMQQWVLEDDGKLARGSSCLGPGSKAGTLVESACISFRSRGGVRWTKASASEPLESQLYRKAKLEHPESFK